VGGGAAVRWWLAKKALQKRVDALHAAWQVWP
jgi:hypothetical protein